MAEQRYEAVRAVIADGETVTDVAARFGVTGACPLSLLTDRSTLTRDSLPC